MEINKVITLYSLAEFLTKRGHPAEFSKKDSHTVHVGLHGQSSNKCNITQIYNSVNSSSFYVSIYTDDPDSENIKNNINAIKVSLEKYCEYCEIKCDKIEVTIYSNKPLV